MTTLSIPSQPRDRKLRQFGPKELIRSDYGRYAAAGETDPLFIHWRQGYRASRLYRLSRARLTSDAPTKLRKIMRLAAFLARRRMEASTGICLSPDAEIGPGLYLGESSSIHVAGGTHIGANCNLSQGVILGNGKRGERCGCPTLGDRVYVGTNAVLIGPIMVGDDAAIGAGAVVTEDVPARAVVAGNPACVISYRGSFDLIEYVGMEKDPGRLWSVRHVSLELQGLSLNAKTPASLVFNRVNVEPRSVEQKSSVMAGVC